MRKYRTILIVALAFIAASALLYYIHFLIFGDIHHIFIYMVGDLAFLPLEVFLVVIVIERIMARREKHSMLNKLNMVIGAFFSEVGTPLIRNLLPGYESCDEISKELAVDVAWTHTDFINAKTCSSIGNGHPHYSIEELDTLRSFLIQKRGFLLRLLENPNLLEHDTFTDLLWATFHLTEEMEARSSFEGLPESDLAHLYNDVHRVYQYLIAEWVDYVEHLKANYPYLFSLVVRTNPFKEKTSPIVV